MLYGLVNVISSFTPCVCDGSARDYRCTLRLPPRACWWDCHFQWHLRYQQSLHLAIPDGSHARSRQFLPTNPYFSFAGNGFSAFHVYVSIEDLSKIPADQDTAKLAASPLVPHDPHE
jgi:hypothetical protein